MTLQFVENYFKLYIFKNLFHLPHYLINQLQRVDYKVILLYTRYKWILLIEKGCKSVLKDCLG